MSWDGQTLIAASHLSQEVKVYNLNGGQYQLVQTITGMCNNHRCTVGVSISSNAQILSIPDPHRTVNDARTSNIQRSVGAVFIYVRNSAGTYQYRDTIWPEPFPSSGTPYWFGFNTDLFNQGMLD